MASVATPREVRAFLLEQNTNGTLPEGVTVGQRGRLSNAAKAYFTEQTGQAVAAEQTTSGDRSSEEVAV